jgi:hypothetical protein
METTSSETIEWQAREALILDMLAGFPSAQGLSQDAVDAYTRLAAAYSLEAVKQACDEFATGVLPVDAHYPPSAAEFVSRVRFVHEVVTKRQDDRPREVKYPIGGQPPAGYVPLGPISVDFGNGPIVNMRHMHPAQKEEVMRRHGLPPPDERPAIEQDPATERATA